MSRSGPSIEHVNFRPHSVNTTNQRLTLFQGSVLQSTHVDTRSNWPVSGLQRGRRILHNKIFTVPR